MREPALHQASVVAVTGDAALLGEFPVERRADRRPAVVLDRGTARGVDADVRQGVAGHAPLGRDAAEGRSGPLPVIRPGAQITSYKDSELDDLLRWIRSDGSEPSNDQLLTIAMEKLGYKKRGREIKARLTESIERTRHRRS